MEQPNIVVLAVDALRMDHCSMHGYHRETTPELDRFGRENLLFSTAISASSHTREAAPPLISGQWPEAYRVGGFTQVEEPFPEQLRTAGYRTGAFHSNPYLSRAYDYDSGFEQFFDDLYLARHRLLALAQKAIDKYVIRKGEYYARAPELNRRALEWLDSLDDEPFFLYTHYMDVHGPYHAPDREFAAESLSASEAEDLYRRSWTDPESITEAEQGLLVDSYDDEIRCLDAKIGSFLADLEERGLLEETLVVITADHGDAFGEHGYYEHPRYLHDEITHVPLFVRPPGGIKGREVSAPVSTLDIVATIEKELGHEISADRTSLFDEIDDERTVFLQVRGEDEYSNVRRYAAKSVDGSGFCERDCETDSIESVACSSRSLREELKAHVNERIRAETGETVTGGDDVDREVERRLTALGYKE
jgi:arylsulfatase